MAPAHSDAFSLLTQETPQWMAKRGSNKETPEWVDRVDGSVNAVTNKYASNEERPQQNSHKVSIYLAVKKYCTFIWKAIIMHTSEK